MSRRSDLQGNGALPNPSKKYLEWDSNNACLRYYNPDKVKKDDDDDMNERIKVPTNLIYLTERSVVVGYHKPSNSKLYSNEINNFKTEAVSVRCKEGELIKGNWSQIKERVDQLGGKMAKRIYCVLDGELVNFTIKGDALATWIEFCKKQPKLRDLQLNNRLLITGAEKKKSGATKYTVPIFGFGEVLTQGEDELAEQAYEELKEYFTSRKASIEMEADYASPEEQEAVPVTVGVGEDDLPF